MEKEDLEAWLKESSFIEGNIDNYFGFLEEVKSGEELAREDNLLNKKYKDFDFFNCHVEGRELFEQAEVVVNYLRKEKMSSIILVDGSARPFYVALKEYFRLKHPNEKVPNIYFINPLGFKARENFTEEEINCNLGCCCWKGIEKGFLKSIKSLQDIRTGEDIISDLKKTFKKLLKNKQEKILLFDTSVYTGDSLEPIKKVLERLNFKDVKVGVITKHSNDLNLNIDFCVTEIKRQDVALYSFSLDRIVKETFESVCSTAEMASDLRKKSIRLRKEIKQIIRDFLKNKMEFPAKN